MGGSTQQSALFQEQGYLLLRDVFTPERVAELKEICDSVLNRTTVD